LEGEEQKVVTFENDDYLTKNRMTPSVTALGDTNLSDATAVTVAYTIRLKLHCIV